MKRLVRLGVIVVLGLLVLLGVMAGARAALDHAAASAEVLGIALVVTLIAAAAVRPRVRPSTVIELDLPAIPSEAPGRSPLSRLQGAPLTIADTVATLRRAASDRRVSAVLVRPRFSAAPTAAIQELSEALRYVAECGKRTIAVADTLGEGVPANGAFALATACREVVVHPSGLVGLTPLSIEPNFYRALLDRIGVQVHVEARREYKTAFNQLTHTGFTEAHQEESFRLIESIWEQLVEAIASGRHLEAAVVRDLADRGPLMAADALAAGLIDRLAYTDEVIDDAKGKSGHLLALAVYKKRAGRGRQKGKPVSIAVVTAVGEIARSGGLPVGITGGPRIAADELAPTLRAVAKNKKVKALVLRIDSPGGSAVASDSIWRELIRVKAAGKPIVASMGAVAASGGYYMAVAADRVVAQPATVTGSIGVISAQFVLADAKAKLSINPAEVHTGTEPSQFSVNRLPSAAQRARGEAQLDSVYGLFMTRVADGRHLPVERVDEVARGRVWTGADAATIGLVDELGGLQRSLDVAIELCGQDPKTSRAVVRPFPKRRGLLSQLRSKGGDSSEDAAAIRMPKLGELTHWVRERELLFHLGADARSYWIH